MEADLRAKELPPTQEIPASIKPAQSQPVEKKAPKA